MTSYDSVIELAADSGDPSAVANEMLRAAGFRDSRVRCYESLDGGNPDMSQVFRVWVSGSDGFPATAIVKIPAKRRVARNREGANGSYAREVEVYRLLSDMQGGFQPLMWCELYAPASRTSALLQEDLGLLPRRTEFNIKLVRAIMLKLAEVHSRFWGDDQIGSSWWIRNEPHADIFNEDTDEFTPNWKILASSSILHPCDQPTVNRVGEYLSDHLLDVLRELDRRPRTLTHGDLHTANMMLRRADTGIEPVLIDWQDAVYNGASSDVAKFLGTTLAPTVARDHFEDLIAVYYGGLSSVVGSTYPFDTFRRDIMLALLGTFANYVICATARVTDEDATGTPNGSLKRVAAVLNVVHPLENL